MIAGFASNGVVGAVRYTRSSGSIERVSRISTSSSVRSVEANFDEIQLRVAVEILEGGGGPAAVHLEGLIGLPDVPGAAAVHVQRGLGARMQEAALRHRDEQVGAPVAVPIPRLGSRAASGAHVVGLGEPAQDVALVGLRGEGPRLAAEEHQDLVAVRDDQIAAAVPVDVGDVDARMLEVEIHLVVGNQQPRAGRHEEVRTGLRLEAGHRLAVEAADEDLAESRDDEQRRGREPVARQTQPVDAPLVGSHCERRPREPYVAPGRGAAGEREPRHTIASHEEHLFRPARRGDEVVGRGSVGQRRHPVRRLPKRSVLALEVDPQLALLIRRELREGGDHHVAPVVAVEIGDFRERGASGTGEGEQLEGRVGCFGAGRRSRGRAGRSTAAASALSLACLLLPLVGRPIASNRARLHLVGALRQSRRMDLSVRGHPLHSRSLSVTLTQRADGRLDVFGEILDLRKRGFVPAAGDLQTSGIVHQMQLRGVVAPETSRLESLSAAQPAVAFEPSALTQGESCRDPIGRIQALVGAPLDRGFARRWLAEAGGPLGCSHILTLGQLLASTVAWALERDRACASGPRRAGERLYRRDLVIDGCAVPGGDLELSLQLTDLHFAPAPALARPIERLGAELEIRALACVAMADMKLAGIQAAERRRTRAETRGGALAAITRLRSRRFSARSSRAAWVARWCAASARTRTRARSSICC